MKLHKKTKLALTEIALFGMLGAMTFAAKVAMAGLPNLEPVSLFVMLFAVVFGIKCMYPIYLYVLMEILLYGINLWNINYLYIWLLLALAAMAMKRLKNPVWFALLSGLFGLAFGFLCTPVYWVLNGWEYALRWWALGVGFDITHAIGNFVIALMLFYPLRKLLEKLYLKLRK